MSANPTPSRHIHREKSPQAADTILRESPLAQVAADGEAGYIGAVDDAHHATTSIAAARRHLQIRERHCSADALSTGKGKGR